MDDELFAHAARERLTAAGYRQDTGNPYSKGRWWWVPGDAYKVAEEEALRQLDAAERGTLPKEDGRWP